MTPPTDDAAAEWFGRVRVGGLDEAGRADFERWREAAPANRAAYEALERAWYGVEAMRDDPRVLALREEALKRNAPWRRMLAPAAMAAGLAVAVIGGGWLAYDAGLIPDRRFHAEAFRTEVGERRAITLPDGSVVTLNTDTVLRTEAAKGRRLVHLDRGQAYFQVAKDRARPFVVSAGGRTVTALGTAFEVRVEPHRFEVTLVEGKVRVEALAPAPVPSKPGEAARLVATEMAPGTQLLASTDTAWKLQEVDAERETSWKTGQLVFLTRPLSEVVAELNRYSDTRIVVTDPALSSTPITGTFRPGDNEGFAAAVASYGMARAAPQADGTIRLLPSS